MIKISKAGKFWFALDGDGCTTQNFPAKKYLVSALKEEEKLMISEGLKYPCTPRVSPVIWYA